MHADANGKVALSRDPGRWFLDHALEMTAVATSVLAAVCYFIGRAGLVGWYDAAGVPQLVFSWSAQDVIIRGLNDEDTWLLVLVSIAGSALYFALLSLLSGWISRQSSRVRSLRQRGETVWSRGERRRRVLTARRARLARKSGAALATQRWRALGNRGGLRRQLVKANRRGWQPPLGLLVILLATCAFIAATFGYIGGVMLLYRMPYANAARDFRDQYVAATGREPPSRQMTSWAQLRRPMTKVALEAAALRGQRQLAGYPFVRVTPKEAPPGAAGDCGWLVQASGGILVLLTSQELLVRNFGDAGFAWKTQAPSTCREPREASAAN